MKEKGVVTKIGQDSAVIEVMPEEACTKCCSCNASGARQIAVVGKNAEGLSVGDKVEYEINTASMLKVYMLLYGFPLIAFAAGIFILYTILHSPIISFVGAITLTVITYVLVGIYLKRNHIFEVEVHPSRGTKTA